MGNGEKRTKLIITEFSSHTQAFLVQDVDRIVRVDWEQVKSPQSIGQVPERHDYRAD